MAGARFTLWPRTDPDFAKRSEARVMSFASAAECAATQPRMAPSIATSPGAASRRRGTAPSARRLLVQHILQLGQRLEIPARMFAVQERREEFGRVAQFLRQSARHAGLPSRLRDPVALRRLVVPAVDESRCEHASRRGEAPSASSSSRPKCGVAHSAPAASTRSVKRTERTASRTIDRAWARRAETRRRRRAKLAAALASVPSAAAIGGRFRLRTHPSRALSPAIGRAIGPRQ